jgi:hypothetical protein
LLHGARVEVDAWAEARHDIFLLMRIDESRNV